MNPNALRSRVKTLSLFAEIGAELTEVERALEAAVDSGDQLLTEVTTHLLKGGGKRIRPALVLLSSRFPEADFSRVLPAAVAAELIHMATLVHDDIIDEADLRRGRPTVNSKWSSHVAVLAGDFFFAKAFMLLADTGDNRLVRLMSNLVYEMSRGELIQSASYFDVEQTEADYYERVKRKTAFFLADSCRAGALAGRATEAEAEALYQYGLKIGISFQIIDDLLDFKGSAEQVGKPVGGDLQAGILTLPVLHALAHAPQGAELRRLIEGRQIGPAEVQQVTEWCEAAGSFAYARSAAERYLAEALDHLQEIERLRSRETLAAVAHFVIDRQF